MEKGITKKGKYIIHKMLKAFHSLALAPSYMLLSSPPTPIPILEPDCPWATNTYGTSLVPTWGPSRNGLFPFKVDLSAYLLWELSLPSAHPSQLNKLLFLKTEYSVRPLAVTSILLTIFSTRGLRTTLMIEAQFAFGVLPPFSEAENGSVFFVLLLSLWKPCPGISDFPGTQ